MTEAGEEGADARPLPPDFYARGAGEVARDLLGALVVSETGGTRCVGEIVETEAYTGPDDEASHAHIRFGKTTRNAAMFGPPGIAYVYRIYGMHWCLNVVTGDEDFPAAVLIRAARPVLGLEEMRARRPGRPDRDLLRGPGNLCRALGVTGEHNFHPVQGAPLRLAPGVPIADGDVAAGPRIGITRAADAPLRFWVRGDPYVSR
ncbi:MAG TPA: DNA-3-methyladenine glycosylase [Longimicrobiaceae bacterium]|nr:DNA-3-methyladenine glycosylase [Longimicrobiaceae bacterium]